MTAEFKNNPFENIFGKKPEPEKNPEKSESKERERPIVIGEKRTIRSGGEDIEVDASAEALSHFGLKPGEKVIDWNGQEVEVIGVSKSDLVYAKTKDGRLVVS